MEYWKIKLQWGTESWEDTGKTILVPTSEVATSLGARDVLAEILQSEWKIVSIEKVRMVVETLV